MTRSMTGLCCLAVTLGLVVPGAEAQEPTGEEGLGLNSLGDSQADLVYTPLTPCRIIDTRLAGGAIAAGTTRNFLVTGTNYSAQGGSATGCGVPYGPATAAVINFVAVNPAGAGNLQLTPYGSALPTASILNYRAGVNLANGLVVAICNPSSATCSSDITIKANVSAADLVADVQGYFHKPPALRVDAVLANTALGEGALSSNTDGGNNSAVGRNALLANSTGSSNSAVGAGALGNNTTGSFNSALGAGALISNTTGIYNSAFGSFALGANTTGTYNSAFGSAALFANTTGGGSSAFGHQALYANTTGVDDSAFGYQALSANTTGGLNSAFGYQALSANTTGADNSAFGCLALHANTTGGLNSAFGRAALFANTTGSFNSAFGIESLSSNTLGTFNAAFGHRALASSTGSYNAAFGQLALWQLTGGNNNIAVGYSAGFSITSGSYNIYVGNNGMSESNTIRVGTVGTQTATYIAGISGATVTGSAVYVNSNGQLGVATSSARYKEQIVAMDAESDVLMKLRPVSFYYRPELDETHLRQYGLVAEEVAEVAPGLVTYDEDGTPQTVRYHFINAMLLNELQKQRRRVENQQQRLEAQDAEISDLRAQQSKIQALEARLAKLEAARGDQ